MLGNFSYYNPTKLYFGDESLNFLKDELKNYGSVVLLNYGSGSLGVLRGRLLGQVLAEAGTGSEMNAGTVITDAEHTFKVGHVFDSRLIILH